jgi:small subunit ribosomal protein S8
MVTDPVGDFIIRLKNGSDAKKPTVEVPYSKFNDAIAHALEKAGYVEKVEKKGKLIFKTLEIGLLYFAGSGARIHDVERISKPSRRVYQKATDIRTYRSGFGNGFYSTPKGIMTDEEAKKARVGGEFLFRIW